jgi:outer membrane protein assembly factor BamB
VRDGKVKWKAFTGGEIRVSPAIWNGRAFVGSADGWMYVFEASSGRVLWRFRAAPVERKIPVYGAISSNWPVASGVVVEDGVAYAAAGIANYDGTHVYALDAVSGKIRWQNNTSGITEGGQGAGVSVQGDMLIFDKKLYLAGGNRITLASYELADGKFEQAKATKFGIDRGGIRGHELFVRKDGSIAVSGRLPWYTRVEDIHYVESAELESSAGTISIATAGLGLLGPGSGDSAEASPLWTSEPFQENVAVAVAQNAVIVAGIDRSFEKGEAAYEESHGISALDIDSGKVLWRHRLPAAAVRWGLAIDREGRLLVGLQDGRVLCYGAVK